MMHDNKFAVPMLWQQAILAMLLALLLTGCGEKRFGGQSAESFTLPSLDGGGSVSLDDYAGDVVYLSFWASWCPPCRQEMPYLAKLRERHHDQGFEVLAINVDEDPELAKAFAAEFDLPFPLLRDAKREVSERYRVPGFPTHYIVDRRGRIRFSGLGFNLADVDAISQEIQTLVAESASATD